MHPPRRAGSAPGPHAQRECGGCGGAERRRLEEDLVAALVDLRKRQAQERANAGTAYRAGMTDLGRYAEGDEYVVTDELGVPVHPEW
jgi:hypothetical protein